MDLFKKTNVVKATTCDYNAPHVVHLKDRGKVAKMLRRYSRRKLKQDLKNKTEELFVSDLTLRIENIAGDMTGAKLVEVINEALEQKGMKGTFIQWESVYDQDK